MNIRLSVLVLFTSSVSKKELSLKEPVRETPNGRCKCFLTTANVHIDSLFQLPGSTLDFFRTVPEKLTDIINILPDLATPTTNVKVGLQPRWNVHLIQTLTQPLESAVSVRLVPQHNYDIDYFDCNKTRCRVLRVTHSTFSKARKCYQDSILYRRSVGDGERSEE